MSKIGHYELLDRVAVGGMAEVFRGRAFGEEGFEKLVAIKRILPNYARDARFVTMLQTEARIHASLSHRNIVQIHDLGVSQEGEYFIVLEYVDGPDLGALLTRLGERRTAARLPDAVALYIAIELGEGVHFAHELRGPDGQRLGLVHRDISPSNVLLSYAGEVKLSDFGLAKRNTDHSVVGSLKGKLAYMSPEQARRGPLDAGSDIFSLGAVLFELLTGHPLRQISDEVTGWTQVAAGVVPAARKFRPDITPALERLLSLALAPDPRDRFPDARGFINEARAALEVLPRSRVGEAGELQAILKAVLPPGAPRPAKTPSKVIRLLSQFGGPLDTADPATLALSGPAEPTPTLPTVAAADMVTPPAAAPPAPSVPAATPPPLPPPVPPPKPDERSAPVTMRRPTNPVVLPPANPEERRSAAGLIAVADSTGTANREARRTEEEERIIAAWPSLGFSGTPAASLVTGAIMPAGTAPPPVVAANRASSSTGKVSPLPPDPAADQITPPARTGRFLPLDARPTRPLAPAPPGAFSYNPPAPPRGSKRGEGSSSALAIVIVLMLGLAATAAAVHFVVAPLPVLVVWAQPARLHIASDPAGAEVLIDGRRLSALTPTYTDVQRDRQAHALELRRQGFHTHRREIRYDKQVELSVAATLVAQPPPPPAPPPPPPPVSPPPANTTPPPGPRLQAAAGGAAAGPRGPTARGDGKRADRRRSKSTRARRRR